MDRTPPQPRDPSSATSRRLAAQAAAHLSWAVTADWSARTRPAREGLLAKFERQVDPDGVLPPSERARRAESARKAYYLRLARLSAQSRRRAAAGADELP